MATIVAVVSRLHSDESGHGDALVSMLLGVLCLVLLGIPVLARMGVDIRPSLQWIRLDPRAVAQLQRTIADIMAIVQ